MSYTNQVTLHVWSAEISALNMISFVVLMFYQQKCVVFKTY